MPIELHNWTELRRQQRRERLETVQSILETETGLRKAARKAFGTTLRSLEPYDLGDDPTEAQLQEFRAWLLAFPSHVARGMATELRKAQGSLGSHDRLHQALEELSFDPAWDALRKSVCPKNSGSHQEFASSVHRLQELSGCSDVARCGRGVPVQTAHDYCWERHGHLPTAQLRFAILKHTGFEALEELESLMERTTPLAQVWEDSGVRKRNLTGKAWGNRFGEFLVLAEALGKSPDVVAREWEPERVAERIQSMRLPDGMEPCKVFRIFAHFLEAVGRDNRVLKRLEALLHPRWSGCCFFDWLLEQSVWNREHLPGVLQAFIEAGGRTHFAETYATVRKSYAGRLLLFASDFVAKEHPSELPPLQWLVERASLETFRTLAKQWLQQKKVMEERVVSLQPGHDCASDAQQTLSLLQNAIQPLVGKRLDLSNITSKQLLKQVKSRRPTDVQETRRTFTKEEMQSLFDVVKGDARWTLMLVILREIGLRVRALGHLRYGMLFTENHTPRATCRVPEKGRTWRMFVTSSRLQSAAKAYSDLLRESTPDIGQEVFLFNVKAPTQALSRSTIEIGLRQIAKEAGVTEVRVHPHVFRHTIVGELLEAGNSMEVASKYMGHATPLVTAQHYWVPTVQDLHNSMNNPFTGTLQKKVDHLDTVREELDATRVKLDAALALLSQQTSVFRTAASQGLSALEALQRFSEQVPDAEDVFRCIVESVSTDTATVPVPEEELIPEDEETSSSSEMASNVVSVVDSEQSTASTVHPEDSASQLGKRSSPSEASTQAPKKKRKR